MGGTSILYLFIFSKLIKIMNSNGYLDSINYFLKRIVIEILLIYFDLFYLSFRTFGFVLDSSLMQIK